MSALTSSGSTWAWRLLRAAILDRDGHVCHIPGPGGQLCGAPADTVDHVVPRRLGGSDDPGNLRAACRPCNYGRPKSSRPPAHAGAGRRTAAPSRDW